MEYDNKNRGALFTNERKESEKHPDFNGTVNVEGKDFRIAAWKKMSKKGKDYMSLSISEAYDTEKPNTPF